MIHIGLLGLGTVGTGIVEILNQRETEISKVLGDSLEIKKILVKDPNKKREIDVKRVLLTSDFKELLNDDEISIIVEVTNDVEQSYQNIKKAITKKKSVVTANKTLVSKYFEELSLLATENNVSFLYEASVGGGIPIIKPLKEEVVLNTITEISGILNGTSNYILTKMFEEGLRYKEALKNAQELGYAEKNPVSDVEGYDAISKLRILGTLSLQGKIKEEDILREGIEKVTALDVQQIKHMDSTLKLFAEVIESTDGYTATVLPTIVKKDSYLAKVRHAYNSVRFKGSHIGELEFYGAGAGKYVTGNAVLRDIIDVAKGCSPKENSLGERVLKNKNSLYKGRFYVRVSTSDKSMRDSMEQLFTHIKKLEKNVIILIEEMEFVKLRETLESIGIKRKDYFVARIVE